MQSTIVLAILKMSFFKSLIAAMDAKIGFSTKMLK